jgi:hypothetical protein
LFIPDPDPGSATLHSLFFLAVDKHSDGSFALKTLKQKLFVDGLCYLIQEIYGVERKSSDEVIDEEIDDTGQSMEYGGEGYSHICQFFLYA